MTAALIGIALPAWTQQPQTQPPEPKPQPRYRPSTRMRDAVIPNVRGMPASLLDKNLPPLSFEQS